MPTRKLIAYALIILMVTSLTAWVWIRQRRERLEKERRHGPGVD